MVHASSNLDGAIAQNDIRPGPGGRVVLITSGGALAWCVANGLIRRFGVIAIIQEKPETKFAIVRRRARLLGWPAALSQAACGVLLRILAPTSKSRRDAIRQEMGISSVLSPDAKIKKVPSVNSESCRDLLRSLNPAVVAVYGTRIITPATLAAVAAPFINYHAGMNPKYRGQHPAYWALANGDAENAGVTVHLVDAGVDTGDILYQERVTFDRRDTIQTYQWAQLPAALPLFERAIDDALLGRLTPRRGDGVSANYFPPTLWTYLLNGVVHGVW